MAPSQVAMPAQPTVPAQTRAPPADRFPCSPTIYCSARENSIDPGILLLRRLRSLGSSLCASGWRLGQTSPVVDLRAGKTGCRQRRPCTLDAHATELHSPLPHGLAARQRNPHPDRRATWPDCPNHFASIADQLDAKVKALIDNLFKVLLAAGVAGFYLLSEQAMILRVLGWLASGDFT